MTTKTVQARNVHAGDEMVLGGDGTRRTTHPIGEKFTNGRTGSVTLRYKVGDVFEEHTFDKAHPLRIRT